MNSQDKNSGESSSALLALRKIIDEIKTLQQWSPTPRTSCRQTPLKSCRHEIAAKASNTDARGCLNRSPEKRQLVPGPIHRSGLHVNVVRSSQAELRTMEHRKTSY